MAIIVCEYCGKPFSGYSVKLCPACTKVIDETYLKVRRYIYQNSKTADFTSIVEGTGIEEKALSYLINKGRIEIANKNGGGLRCRACGKETGGGNLCDQCKTKLALEKLTEKADELKRSAAISDMRKRIVPISFNDD
jgi:predicted amidophosphoribosyltransferase